MQKTVLRDLFNTITLLESAVIAHFLAEGTFIAPSKFVAAALISLIFILPFRSRKLAGPELAMLILLVQSLGHFILGGNSHNNLMMAFSHITIGLLTYIAINAVEGFWSKASEVLLQIFLPNLVSHFTLNATEILAPRLTPWIFNPFSEMASTPMRGPPSQLSWIRLTTEFGNL